MKAVIYARYSSDNQREESIEGQLRECKEYAEKNGIMILRSYIDRALSAKTDNRPEFQKMVQDSAKGLFDTVLVWKLDRFARNRYDSAHYKAVLRRNGVKVVSTTENISDGPEGIILESMLEGMAEYYSAELVQKINRGLTENALKGKNNGGGIPLGYQLTDDQHLRIDLLTAPIVREIYQRYAEGETVRSIITSLNEPVLRPPCFGCRKAHRTGNCLRLSLQPSCFKLTGQFNNLAVQVGNCLLYTSRRPFPSRPTSIRRMVS